MKQVNLNQENNEVGNIFKVITISLTVTLNLIVLTWFFLFSGITKYMTFFDNWARIFVVITFLIFGETQIIGGLALNLIAFVLFLAAVGYFAFTGKMAKMFGIINENK